MHESGYDSSPSFSRHHKDTRHSLAPPLARSSLSPTMITTATVSSVHLQVPDIRIFDEEPSEDRFTSLPARALRLKLNTSDNTSLGHAAQPVIKLWRGHCDSYGSLYLRVPSPASTSGSRLALARQGVATGSYKLNCSETAFANGRRKIDTELQSRGLSDATRARKDCPGDNKVLGTTAKAPEKGAYGGDAENMPLSRTFMRSYHPPPKIRPRFDVTRRENLTSSYDNDDSLEGRTSPPSFAEEVKSNVFTGLKHERRNCKPDTKKSPASTGLTSLSRSYTFTEGLCNLVDSDDETSQDDKQDDEEHFKDHLEAEKARIKSRLGLHSSMRSSITVSGSLRRLAQSMDTASRKWFDSLRRTQIMERKASETLKRTTSFRSLSMLGGTAQQEQVSVNTPTIAKHRPVFDIFPELHGFRFADFRFTKKKPVQVHKSGKSLKKQKRRSCGDLRSKECAKAQDGGPQALPSDAIAALPRSTSLPIANLALVTTIDEIAQEMGQGAVTIDGER